MRALLREAVDLALARTEDADGPWEALLRRWPAMPAAEAHGTWRREDLDHQRLARYDNAAR